jgi:hypothetical protein
MATTTASRPRSDDHRRSPRDDAPSVPRSVVVDLHSTGVMTHLLTSPGVTPSSTKPTSRGSADFFQRSYRNSVAPILG